MCPAFRSVPTRSFRGLDEEARDSHAAAGPAGALRFVDDTQPGIRRYRRGKGYLYTMPASAGSKGRPTPIHDEATLARIKSLDIPDGWRQVWISPDPDGHLQATGRDSRGRRQSRYHARWRDFREETRFDRMLDFSAMLPGMRDRIEADMGLPNMPRECILAMLICMMDSAGNGAGRTRELPTKSEGSKRTKSQANAVLWFQINGRGKKYRIELAEGHLNRRVCEYIDLPGFELFQYVDGDGKRARIDCSDINEYVRSSTGCEFTARDFRTWCASLLAFEFLGQSRLPQGEEEANKRVREVVRRVSRRLSHTPAMCRKCLIHPAVIESYLGGTLHGWLDAAESTSSGTTRHADFLRLAVQERCLYCLLEDYAERSRASPS